jgi:dephospho-CoA kinase
MMVVGLTGSIGMGKSTVATMFRELGVPVFDADAIVHSLQRPNGRLLPVIEAAFPGTTNEKTGVDRVKLGDEVFGDDDALRRLERIVHPAVAEERAAFLEANVGAPLVIFDIPLLFEKGNEKLVEAVVVVSAPADIQRSRVLARPGMTEAKFEQIIARQMPDADKRKRADHVIDTGASLDATKARVAEVTACLAAAKDR